MFEWLEPSIVTLAGVTITRVHLIAAVAALGVAGIAWQRQRSPLLWYLLSVAGFVAGHALVAGLLPPVTLAEGETPGVGYTLWKDPELRADVGLLLALTGVGLALAWLSGRLMRAANTTRRTITGEIAPLAARWQRTASAVVGGLLLVFPLVIWAGTLIVAALEGAGTDFWGPVALFVAIFAGTIALALGLDGERRNLALWGLGFGLLLAQVRYNATRPATESIFEPTGAVPFFLALIPFLLGLAAAGIVQQRAPHRQYTLMGWYLGALAWIAVIIGFTVKVLGYYDYEGTYAFMLGALLEAPLRFVEAFARLYYDVVPGNIPDADNVTNMERWAVVLPALGGLLGGLVVLNALLSLPRPQGKLTLAIYIERVRRIDLTLSQKRYLLAFVLIAPAVALRTFTTFYPFVQTLALSVQRYNPAFPPRRYIDLRNFEKLTTDLVVRESLEFTLIFVFVSTFFQMVLGLMIAHLLNANFSLRGLARTISLIPWAIPMVVAAIGFRWMFDDQFGMIPDLLRRVGYDEKWLVDPDNARLAVTFVNIWKSTPFAALLLLAGLQGVNEDLYEAARVDGANWYHALRYITVPLLMPIIVTVSMFLLVWQLAVFDLPFAMTGGGPGFSTTVLAQKIYLEINSLNYSDAAAISIFLVLVVSIIGGAGLYVLRRVEVRA